MNSGRVKIGTSAMSSREKFDLANVQQLKAAWDMLNRAGNLLAHHGELSRGASARDRYGFVCQPAAAVACKWSMLGALYAVRPDPGDLMSVCIVAIERAIDMRSITEYQDDPAVTVDDVIDTLRCAGDFVRNEIAWTPIAETVDA